MTAFQAGIIERSVNAVTDLPPDRPPFADPSPIVPDFDREDAVAWTQGGAREIGRRAGKQLRQIVDAKRR